jgi:cupin 2 domain-containing protein
MASTPPNEASPDTNLFSQSAPPESGEQFLTLLKHRQLHIERIVSGSDVTPVDMIQAQDEWVVLLRGEAELLIRGMAHPLREGDHVFIPAGTLHRVAAVSPGALWLAVHLHPDPRTPPE